MLDTVKHVVETMCRSMADDFDPVYSIVKESTGKHLDNPSYLRKREQDS